MVSLKSGEISVLHEITFLSDPVTYGTLEVMVDWHCSKYVQACPSCIHFVVIWTGLHVIVVPACTIIGLISLDTYLGECAAVLVLQCYLATSCTPGTTRS